MFEHTVERRFNWVKVVNVWLKFWIPLAILIVLLNKWGII